MFLTLMPLAVARMTDREKRLLGAAGATFAGMAALLVGYFVWDGLSAVGERNQAMAGALRELELHADEYREAGRQRASADRQSRPPPSLLGYLEQAAQESGVTIPESSERPALPRGTDYQEHAIDVKMRGVALGPLVKFLEKVERGASLVQTTGLGVRTRFQQHDVMDVEATFATYAKVERAAPSSARSPHPAAPAAGKPESEEAP